MNVIHALLKKLIMRILLFTISLSSLLVSCHKNEVITGPPTCLSNKISDFTQMACQNGASARKYTFQNSTVYVLDPGNCGADMQSIVLDEQCNSLGTLGGITGNTQINGVDFSSSSQYIETVWTN